MSSISYAIKIKSIFFFLRTSLSYKTELDNPKKNIFSIHFSIFLLVKLIRINLQHIFKYSINYLFFSEHLLQRDTEKFLCKHAKINKSNKKKIIIK